MRPGTNMVRALVALCGLAILVPLVPQVTYVLWAAALAVLAAGAVEYHLLRSVRLTHEESEAFAVSLDEEERIFFRLATDASRPVRMTVRRVWPALVPGPSAVLQGVCAPGHVLPFECPVRAVSRGTAKLEGPHVAITFWGWAERHVALPGASELRVLPNLKAVRRLHTSFNDFVLRGLGQRTAPRLGKGREFDRLREYNRDDDIRDIAWKATARHGKFIVREYRLDRSQDVLLCVDRGHRMAAPTTRIRRIDHALNAALLAAYLSNRMEDRVGMLSFGARVDSGVPQGHGAAHLNRITAFATAMEAEYVHTDYLALGAHVRRRLRHRSLILILTTLPEEDQQHALVRAVGMLRPTHLPVVVVLSDPALRAAAESRPESKPELCRTLVAREVWMQRRRMMDELRRRGAWVVDTGPEEAGIESANAYIEIKRRQLL